MVAGAAHSQKVHRGFTSEALFSQERPPAFGGSFLREKVGNHQLLSIPSGSNYNILYSTDGINPPRALANGRVGGVSTRFRWIARTRSRVFLWTNGLLVATDGSEAGTTSFEVDWIPAGGWRILGSTGETALFPVRRSGSSAEELAVSDGTRQGTRVLELGRQFDFGLGRGFAIGEAVYFSAASGLDSSGEEVLSGIWKTDGTQAGTTQIIDPEGTNASWWLTRTHGELIVVEEDIGNAIRLHRLLSDDSLQHYATLPPASLPSFSLESDDRAVLFAGSPGRGDEFWTTNGTAAGTRIVSNIPDPAPFSDYRTWRWDFVGSMLIFGFGSERRESIYAASTDEDRFVTIAETCSASCDGFLLVDSTESHVLFYEGNSVWLTDGQTTEILDLEGPVLQSAVLYEQAVIYAVDDGESGPTTWWTYSIEHKTSARLALPPGSFQSFGLSSADGVPLAIHGFDGRPAVVRLEYDGRVTPNAQFLAQRSDFGGDLSSRGEDGFVVLHRKFNRMDLYSGAGSQVEQTTEVDRTAAYRISEGHVLAGNNREALLAFDAVGEVAPLTPSVSIRTSAGVSKEGIYFFGKRLDEDLGSELLFLVKPGVTEIEIIDMAPSYELQIFDDGILYRAGNDWFIRRSGLSTHVLTAEAQVRTATNGVDLFLLILEDPVRLFRIEGGSAEPEEIALPIDENGPTGLGAATAHSVVLYYDQNPVELNLGSGSVLPLAEGTPSDVTPVDGVTYFSLGESSVRALFTTSTTFAAGTPVRPADQTQLFDAKEFVEFDGYVYYSAYHAEVGAELWRNRPGESAAELVRDLNPGPYGSAPFSLTRSGNKLYFLADDGKSATGVFYLQGGEQQTQCGGEYSLCLQNRFDVEVDWTTEQNTAGRGVPRDLTNDTGSFWFFNEENVELVVKVLDGRAITDHFWTFFGALSNVQYSVDVLDINSGKAVRYGNPQGTFASRGDVRSLSGNLLRSGPETRLRSAEDAADLVRASPAQSIQTQDVGPCELAALCLGEDNRFEVKLEWTEFGGNQGSGIPTVLTRDTGYFWFFNEDNVEVVVKVLDATAFAGTYWVFSGSLTNVAYEMRVRDTFTGAVRVYTNELGTFKSFGDTDAFPADQ